MRHKLKPGAVPSQFSWTKPLSTSVIGKRKRAVRKNQSRNNSSSTVVQCHSLDDGDVGAEVQVDTVVEVVESTSSTATVATMTDQHENDNSFLNHSGQNQIINFEMLMKDDKALHFYSGLENSSKLTCVFQSLGPAAYKLNYFYGQIHKPKVEDQFLLVLMKLRQNKCNYELGIMFGITEKDVYNIFVTWIRFMSLQWREINLWPSKDLVKFYSPDNFFDKFPDTRVIVDGTECPVKQSKLPETQQATFSTYKNCNTVKVVVGSTPGGLVSYISPAYGGL